MKRGMIPLKCNENTIGKAVKVIESGGIVLLPTETVYGVAGDAYSHDVFTKISILKARPQDKPFPLQLGKAEDVFYLLKKINLTAMLLMKRLWPGALTIIFEGGGDLPSFLKSKDGKIGIRVPDYAPLRLLLAKIRRPIIVTSANKSGEKSPNSLEEVKEEIKKGVDLILDSGKTSLEQESTVVDITKDVPDILREGAVKKERLRDSLSLKKIAFICTGNSCRSVMAKYYLEKIFKNKEIKGIELDSAGIGRVEGLRASSLTLEVLKEEGIDASSHCAKPVTKELVKENDLIVVMGKNHCNFLREKFPESEGKIRLLGNFFAEESSSSEISDPIGQGKDVYKACLFRIKTGLEGLVKEIIQVRGAFA